MDKLTDKDYLSIPDLISLKRKGIQLSPCNISQMVRSIANGSMEDAQIGAMLMAIFLKGMTETETFQLTNEMKNSGKTFNWPGNWITGDKHSTGGVGDKVSIPLAPALAACGLKVPMISGRGLGHTGGTLDKLESIPGYRVLLSEEEIFDALAKVGCCIVGQTDTLVPADKKMYSVRDITSTVMSTPLIVSSIISKKAAESLHGLVLDVKIGVGASTGSSTEEVESMAREMVATAEALGIRTTAIISRMDAPLGHAVGNALEIKESLKCLRGKGPDDLRQMVLHLGGELLTNTGLSRTPSHGREMISTVLDNGEALKTFKKMLQNQGVHEDFADQLCGNTAADESSLPKSKFVTNLLTEKAGIITSMNALTVAKACSLLGAGRAKSSDEINLGAGVVLHKVVGDPVRENDSWIEVHHDSPLTSDWINFLESALVLQEEPASATPSPLILKRIAAVE